MMSSVALVIQNHQFTNAPKNNFILLLLMYFETELESLKQRLKQAETAKKNMETLRIQLDKATLEIETLRTDAGVLNFLFRFMRHPFS